MWQKLIELGNSIPDEEMAKFPRDGAERLDEYLPVWQKLIELGHSIPDEELARVPRDGARNADHYLHGSPRQD